MAMGDRQQAKVLRLAEEQLGRPVLGAAIVTRPRRGVGAASFGAVGALVQTAVASRRTIPVDFAAFNLFVVTEDALHVFELGGATSSRVRSTIGSWPWESFGAWVEGRGMTRDLILVWDDGAAAKLQAPVKGNQKFQQAVLDQIVHRTAVAQDGGPVLG